LVARLLWEQDAAGSNPVIPIFVTCESPDPAGPTSKPTTMDTVDLKRDIELLKHRLGKTQDYL
jgi:hypothetical protein